MFLFEKYVSLWPNRIIWEYMERNQFTHMAFISYKREDEKWAKWLQQKLESYRLPVAIRKEHQDLPERLSPIFRDTTDFSGGVLADAITNGLKASRHLIVICSPLAANSKWVCKEVEDFRNLGKSAQIIPFIIEGEAHSKDPDKECFPKSLLELSESEEVLGININENGREAAFVKVVATMLGLEFDALWQRHQRAERRRRRMVMGGLMGFILMLLGVAGWISWQYVELNKRNNLIETQNREIDMKNDSILRVNQVLADANRTIQLANDSIERAYNKLSVSEHNLMLKNFELEEANNRIQREQKSTYIAASKLLAEKVRMTVAQGDALQAMMALLEVMPDNLDNPDRPYVAEMDAALRIALDSVRTQNLRYLLTDGYDMEFYRFSKTEKYIYKLESYDEAGYLYKKMSVYDADNFQLLGSQYWRSIDVEKIYEHNNDEYFVVTQKNDATIRKYPIPSLKEKEVFFRFDKENERRVKNMMDGMCIYDGGYGLVSMFPDYPKCSTRDGLKNIGSSEIGTIVSWKNAFNSYFVSGDLVQNAVNAHFKENGGYREHGLYAGNRYKLESGYCLHFHDNYGKYKDWDYREDNNNFISVLGIIYDNYFLIEVDAEDDDDRLYVRKVLDIKSGVCVCDDLEKYQDIENNMPKSHYTTYLFPSYPDLIKQCKDIVKGMKLNPSVRKKYFLE